MDTHHSADLRRQVATVLRVDPLSSTTSTDNLQRLQFISNAAQTVFDLTDPFTREPFTRSGMSTCTPVAVSIEEMLGFARAYLRVTLEALTRYVIRLEKKGGL
ncbi:hypothetical protein [Cupriavidus sp. IK-TO18]|uniref:hypothetical protein n=1 Tax=Cupriavidus sp. IK-TO18 TaxID=2782182 RepID=UPI00189985C0|nr:hypothetical protein [Cupriavidus sp. IK-TO18]MBF6989007.1 hypothetical protein [Cupriavidus sp. IK-TO18]